MNNWKYHDNKMRELKKIYNYTNKQTQNNLQEIFDSYKMDFEHLYNITDNKTLNRVKTKIEEWKDKGLLNGYFGMLANNIYKRTRVKNSEILELLIYGVYIEEQNKLEETELNTFKDVSNHYYQEGQKEVNQTLPKKKRKLVSTLDMALFLALLDTQNARGYVWKQYVEAIIKYNADQIYRQMLINIQQNKENNIDNSVFQNIIAKQQNAKLSINQDKISGAVDNELIGLNNLAKVEGIKKVAGNNSKVKFIAIIDGKETDMCHSLEGQTFYINKENIFDRYYGETQKDLRIERIKCFGLVVGLNLPPISHHFHYCRSSITYQASSEELENKYNIFGSKLEKEIKDSYNIKKAKLKGIDKDVLTNILDNMNNVYKDFPQLKDKIKLIKSIEHPTGGLNITPDINDNTYVMQINRKFFSSENIAKKQYEKDLKTGFHPKGTTYKDMGIHELGHSCIYEIIKNKYNKKSDIINDWNNNITAKEILQKSFNNLGIYNNAEKGLLRRNISIYAKKNESETIGEAFADYYANKKDASLLSKEIIKIMKGMI